MSEEAKAPEAAKEAPKAAPKSGLDLTKPYGTIHGGTTGAAYFQDGKYYDGSGKPAKV